MMMERKVVQRSIDDHRYLAVTLTHANSNAKSKGVTGSDYWGVQHNYLSWSVQTQKCYVSAVSTGESVAST